VHPGAGTPQNTLTHALLAHTPHLSQLESERPGIVHRLDKGTSGLLVCAKNDRAHAHLALQFREKSNLRVYDALSEGLLGKDVVDISCYLKRDPHHRLRFARANDGKWSRSIFSQTQILSGRYSLMSVKLHTGRTHQVRVHAALLKAPLVGDSLYGQNLRVKACRPMLHARMLGFKHPDTEEWMTFEAPWPEDFQNMHTQLSNS
jgi:23S rRNA pseudouridine1911/1915/1917 synthase